MVPEFVEDEFGYPVLTVVGRIMEVELCYNVMIMVVIRPMITAVGLQDLVNLHFIYNERRSTLVVAANILVYRIEHLSAFRRGWQTTGWASCSTAGPLGFLSLFGAPVIVRVGRFRVAIGKPIRRWEAAYHPTGGRGFFVTDALLRPSETAASCRGMAGVFASHTTSYRQSER